MRRIMQGSVGMALLLLAVLLQWAFAQQGYSSSAKDSCTDLKPTSCEMVIVATPLHGTSESTLLSLVVRNTTRLVQGYNIPPSCWSDAGDLTMQHHSQSACTRNVRPGEQYLFCLEALSGECPRLAPGIKPVPLTQLTQAASHNARDDGRALLRRRRQERPSTSKQ